MGARFDPAWRFLRSAEVFRIAGGGPVGRPPKRACHTCPSLVNFSLPQWGSHRNLTFGRNIGPAGSRYFSHAELVEQLAAGLRISEARRALLGASAGSTFGSVPGTFFWNRDEIAYRTYREQADISAARRDFGYHPRSLWDYLTRVSPADPETPPQVKV